MDMRDLPSIKKTQEAIQTEVAAFKKGPGMHDSGGGQRPCRLLVKGRGEGKRQGAKMRNVGRAIT